MWSAVNSYNKMFIRKLYTIAAIFGSAISVHYPGAASETSGEEKAVEDNTSSDTRAETNNFASRNLEEALSTVLNKQSIITDDMELESDDEHEAIPSTSTNMEAFFKDMDRLNNDICKKYQHSLWAFVVDSKSREKKDAVLSAAIQQSRARKEYWNILNKNYLHAEHMNDPHIKRKIRIVKEMGINALTPNSKESEQISSMQNIWIDALVCEYNKTCTFKDTKSYSDIMTVFKTSNDSDELAYYWKAFRDATGQKIRPLFKKYVKTMNDAAKAQNFSDAGELWRYTFEDEDLVKKTKEWWREMLPLYNLLKQYVKRKLKNVYEKLNSDDESIPAHLLGNMWAQDWQTLYPLVAPYPDIDILTGLNRTSVNLFIDIDDFHRSLGFSSAIGATGGHFQVDTSQSDSVECISSSYDMCDGINYRMKWCNRTDEPILKTVSIAAYLLSQIQYFRHYRDLPMHYRDGPTPAFKEAIPNILATQMTSPELLKRFKLLKNEPKKLSSEIYINHLMWVALEKLPLAAYAYAIETWRWDVFAGVSQWNNHWWNIRTNDTGISPPLERSDIDLDPSSKFHVVSHNQYIMYFISPILEFQILKGLCKTKNRRSLHRCSIYGSKIAGTLLSDAMSRGAADSWKSILFNLTGEQDISTEALLEYFQPLQEFLTEEIRPRNKFDKSAISIGIGATLAIIIIIVGVWYVLKRSGGLASGMFGLRSTGSLNLGTEYMSDKNVETAGFSEAKV